MNDEIRMTNVELPDGWLRVPFSAVTVNPVQRVPSEKEQITYIDIGSVDRITKQVVEPQTMLGKDAPSRARKVIQTGDVLVSTVRPNLNAVALVESQYNGQFASTGFDVLRSPVVDPRWLFYSVRTPEFLDRMSELVQGALYPAVRSFDIRSFVIPIAPLAEQKRIADKLEAVLGRVDACRARLDRVPALLKRFRQSVLASATSGGLTAEWRMTNGMNDEWEKEAVGSIITKVEAGLNVQCEERPPRADEKGLVKISAVTWGTYDDEKSKTLPTRLQVPESTKIGVGDFLISRANTLELVGACVIVHKTSRPVYLSDKILRLVMPADMKPWLLMVLQSPNGRKQIESLATGNQLSMRNLAQANLRQIQVPKPTPQEREEIVRRVEDLFAFADRIEARLTVAKKTIERLTPSVLAKAFRGELVSQDPNDEPATALLDRLRSQPLAKPAKAKRTKRQ